MEMPSAQAQQWAGVTGQARTDLRIAKDEPTSFCKRPSSWADGNEDPYRTGTKRDPRVARRDGEGRVRASTSKGRVHISVWARRQPLPGGMV